MTLKSGYVANDPEIYVPNVYCIAEILTAKSIMFIFAGIRWMHFKFLSFCSCTIVCNISNWMPFSYSILFADIDFILSCYYFCPITVWNMMSR